MPNSQTAVVAQYHVGLPATKGSVLRFKKRPNRGGVIGFRLENSGDTTVTVSLEVSLDDTTYAATTSANNLEAVTDVVIPPRVFREFTVLLRAGADTYLRVAGSGGELDVQMRGDKILNILDSANPAPDA